MKKLKKAAARLMSLAVAAVTALSIGANASAVGITYQWGVDRSLANTDDRYGWVGNGSTKFSVDDKVHTDNTWYSIKLENTDYNYSAVERTYNVEPNTKYKLSAMVKYSGFQLDPNAEKNATGAHIGITYSNFDTGFTTSNEWTLLEFEFTTGNDETTRNLRLQNGRSGSNCKGTAWFSDVKLEKAELTNNWDILTVFFKNADANVTIDGEQVRHQLSLRESDINDINTLILDKLPETLKTLSNNKMSVNSIDRYYVDEALTEKDLAVNSYKDEAQTIPDGYRIDEKNSVLINKVLDKYLAQKHYNQVLIFVPLKGINNGWWGLGGTKYKNVHFAQITNSWDGAFEKGDRFQGQVVVHEITHGLEHDSMGINGDKTPNFHDILNDYPSQYPKSVDVDYYERIHQYLTCTLPDGRGVDPSVFYRLTGKYTIVDNDMTTGTGITPGSSSVTPPAPTNFRAESTSDTNIKFSWDAVPNADGYQFVRFKAADHKEMSRDPSDYKADKLSATWGPFTKGATLYYGIRAAYSQNGTTVYSDWAYLTYTHTGVSSSEVIKGDINNDGKFTLTDVTAALRIYVNNTAVDQRTLNAAGISGRTNLQLSDIVALLKSYVNS